MKKPTIFKYIFCAAMLALCMLLLCACGSEKKTMTYSAAKGGIVTGDTEQTVREGKEGTEVRALAQNGYRFAGWSDGVEAPARTDLGESLDVQALFEPVTVDFYADGLLVRSIPVVDFFFTDPGRLIGYKSAYEFLGWKFTDAYLESHPEYREVEGFAQAMDCIISAFSSPVGTPDKENPSFEVVWGEADPNWNPLQNLTIAHGGGSDTDTVKMNTKEGLLHHLSLGQRFVEMDIAITSDGRSVAYHIGYVRGDHTRPMPLEMTLAEFMVHDNDGYTSMSLADLFEIMREYPDLVVNFDVLSAYNGYAGANGNKYLGLQIFFDEVKALTGGDTPTAEDLQVRERMMVELLPFVMDEMLADGKACGMELFLLPFGEYYENQHQVDDSALFAEVCRWACANGVEYMSFHDLSAEKVAQVKAYGIITMVNTYNDPLKLYEYWDRGVDCIFTDFHFI